MALQVFRMLTPEERNDYAKAIGALRKRFKLVAIEELRGMEFHQLMQDSQSIEQLGIELQRLARKAFPSISGKEQDILLKGRFYQALLPRWQRKLVPKPEETFTELYDRVRTLEKHEKQYATSAAARAENTKTDKKHVSNYGKQKPNQRVLNNNVATKSNQNKLGSENAIWYQILNPQMLQHRNGQHNLLVLVSHKIQISAIAVVKLGIMIATANR